MQNDLELLCLALSCARPSEYQAEFDKWVLARAVSDTLADHARDWVAVDTVISAAVPYLSAAYAEEVKKEWVWRMLRSLDTDGEWAYLTKADAIDCKGGLIRLRSVRLAEEEKRAKEAKEAKAAEEKRLKEERDRQFAAELEATREQRAAMEAAQAAKAKVRVEEEREAQRQKALEVERLAELTLPWLMAPLQRKDFMFGAGVLEGHITAFLALHGGAALALEVTAELVARERAVWRDGERLAISECYRLRLDELA